MSIKRDRPWGWYKCICRGENYAVKKIWVAPNQRLSLQYHNLRAEHWTVVKGTGVVTQGTLERACKPGDTFDITKPDGTVIRVTVKGYFNIDTSVNRADSFFIEEALHGPQTHYVLDWHNCYSFGNGVESNRIRDAFNLSQIINGVKASTTVNEPYQEQYRKHGLIYSGIYNDIGGVNNLNQFIAAEKITKDLNPTYGSIQKLHTRDTDLIALCEDKVLQILATKDA